MNCEAQFSEIFTRRVFGFLNAAQKETLVSQFINTGFCQRCDSVFSNTTEVFLHYLTSAMLIKWVSDGKTFSLAIVD